ncbi:MAG: hypothetical protein KDE35_08565, partial [Geminicoccaceae bacterium]|nr:hypothetical protein [Geminicoccaceae bacterium]
GVPGAGGDPGAGGVPGMGGDPGMGGAPMPIDALRGDVFFIETITAGAQFPTLEGGAEFGHYTRAPTPAAAVDQAGDCFLFDGAAADPGQFTAVSAGDVSLTGGAEDVTMAYDDFVDAYALDPFCPIDLWSDGDTVTVGADGSDDFGAFSTVLPAPEALAGVEPAAGDARAPPKADPKRLALVVADPRRDVGASANDRERARASAALVIRALGDRGFAIEHVPSASPEEIASSIERIRMRADDDTTLLVYWAGGAARESGDGRIALFETPTASTPLFDDLPWSGQFEADLCLFDLVTLAPERLRGPAPADGASEDPQNRSDGACRARVAAPGPFTAAALRPEASLLARAFARSLESRDLRLPIVLLRLREAAVESGDATAVPPLELEGDWASVDLAGAGVR